jgi:tetratricopeptide (TPR) repeat protein
LDSLFASYDISDDVISETVQSLNSARQYRAAVNLLYAAVRNDQVKPWMYGALNLSLEMDQAPIRERERAILSSAPFLTSPGERFELGRLLERIGSNKRALQFYCETCKMAPQFAEAYSNGIRLAQILNDEKAMKELTIGIASQSWSGSEMEEIWKRGSNLANGLIAKMRTENRNREADEYTAALREALRCDLVVRFEYTGDAEVDIAVKEPANTICWFGNPRTFAGGVLGKNRLSSGQQGIKRGNYACPTGFSGTYEILIERVWGNVTANRVSVTVLTHYGTDRETKETKYVPLDENGMVRIRFELKDGRRTESIGEAELAALLEEATRIRSANVISRNMNQAQSPNTNATNAQEEANRRNQTQQRNEPPMLLVPSGNVIDAPVQTPGRRQVIRISPEAGFQSTRNTVEYGKPSR